MATTNKARTQRQQTVDALRVLGRARPQDVAKHLGRGGDPRPVADSLRQLFEDGLAAQVKVMTETRSGGYNRGQAKKVALVYYELLPTNEEE